LPVACIHPRLVACHVEEARVLPLHGGSDIGPFYAARQCAGRRLWSRPQTKTGWTVGAGAEYALVNRWSVKAEYLYAQFTGLGGTSALVSTVPTGFSNVFTGRTGTFSDNIVRVGLNYRFGGPVVARY
jgi:opacity protein-like surface antigen